jgi:hypothetical protein
VFFVIQPDRARLADLAQRIRDGRLKPIVGAVVGRDQRRSPRSGLQSQPRASETARRDYPRRATSASSIVSPRSHEAID